MTKVLKIDLQNPNANHIARAAHVLENDGVVIYPTDTAYGIGVNATSTIALKKLYELKGREKTKPTHVVVKDWNMIKGLGHPNNKARIIYDELLPGPITMIIKKNSRVNPVLTGGLETIGVRMPNSNVTKLLSSLLSFPYTTPSANRSGEATPYSLEDVKRVIDVSKVDIILHASHLSKTLPSTIIDTTTDPIKILREGPVTESQIINVLFDKRKHEMR